MGKYKIEIKKSAVKELKSIPKSDLYSIIGKIQNLSENPRPCGVQKLAHYELYRIRQGDYRIIYTIDDNLVLVQVVKIGHRKDVYNL